MRDAPDHSPDPKVLADRDEHVVERRSLRDYYIIVRERLWIALPLALLVALPLAYFRMRATPMYQARATMQFERPDKIVSSDQVVDQAPRSEVDINTYLERLNSASLRAQVVQSLTPDEIRILQRPYLKDLPPGASPPPAGAVLGNVHADAVRGSLIIVITAQSRSPEGAALVANRYYRQFVDFLLQQSGGTNQDAINFLQHRADQLQKEYTDKLERLQEYKKANNLISLDDSLNIVSDRLKTIATALTNARLQRLDLQVSYDQVEDYQKSGRDLLEISYIARHGAIPGLKAQLTDAIQRQSVLSERYLARYPKMIEIAQTITALREQLKKAILLAVSDLASSLQNAQQTETALNQAYQKQEQEQLRLDDLRVGFNSLRDQAAAAKDAYTQVLNSLNKATTSKGIDYQVPVSLIDPATPSYTPYSPNKSRIARTSVLLGLLVFFGVAFGLNLVDDRIKSAWDVESFLGANLLGIIPDLSGVKEEDRPLLAIKAKATPGVEAFLSVYSAVKIQSKLDFPKILLVTSTIPGEGKTLISANIAGSFARHGRSTLLIDCDMRRPMLHRHFQLPNDAGVIAWAEGGGTPDDDPMTDPRLGLVRVADNLWLLRSGGRSKTPTEFLETPLFGRFLEKLKRRFDLVVLDSPPAGAVSDCLLLAEHTDEIIYVARFNRAYRKHIRQFVRLLQQGRAEFLGIVLNGLSPRRIEYYTNYRYYRSYKKYYGSQS